MAQRDAILIMTDSLGLKKREATEGIRAHVCAIAYFKDWAIFAVGDGAHRSVARGAEASAFVM
jgi:hypothetical protein